MAPVLFMNYRTEVQTLVCRARQLGSLTQVSVDGFLPNSRLNLAMGLAVIHVAQAMTVSMMSRLAVVKSAVVVEIIEKNC